MSRTTFAPLQSPAVCLQGKHAQGVPCPACHTGISLQVGDATKCYWLKEHSTGLWRSRAPSTTTSRRPGTAYVWSRSCLGLCSAHMSDCVLGRAWRRCAIRLVVTIVVVLACCYFQRLHYSTFQAAKMMVQVPGVYQLRSSKRQADDGHRWVVWCQQKSVGRACTAWIEALQWS